MKGDHVKERLACGCVVQGTKGANPPDWTRTPCDRHTASGACIPCRDGRSHPTCDECGLSDGAHSATCREGSP